MLKDQGDSRCGKRETAFRRGQGSRDEYKQQDQKVKLLVKERKTEIWSQKVTSAKAKAEIGSVLRSLTINRTNATDRIIPDNVKNLVSSKLKSKCFVKLQKEMSIQVR